jgi:hypothetical protein
MTKGLAAIFAAILISGSAWGAQPQADPPLVVNGDLALTANDFEAYLERCRSSCAPISGPTSSVSGRPSTASGAAHGGAEGARRRPRQRPLVAARLAQAQETVLVEAYMLQIE